MDSEINNGSKRLLKKVEASFSGLKASIMDSLRRLLILFRYLLIMALYRLLPIRLFEKPSLRGFTILLVSYAVLLTCWACLFGWAAIGTGTAILLTIHLGMHFIAKWIENEVSDRASVSEDDQS